MRLQRFLAGLTAGALLAGGAVVATATPAAAATSNVTVVHGIPGATVDVYAGGNLLLEDFTFGTFAGPVAVEEGMLDVEVFAADADPETATPVIDQMLAIPADETISAVAHLDAEGTPRLSAFVETNDPVDRGIGRISVRHTAAAPAVDVVTPAGDAVTDLVNGERAEVELPAGSYDLGVGVAPDGPVALPLPNVVVAPGQQLDVYAVGSAGDGSLTVLTRSVDVVERSGVRVVHGIPGLTVDVYVDGGLLLEDFAPTSVAGPVQVMPGDHLLEVFVAGADPDVDDPALSTTATVPEGIDASVVANLAGGAPDLDVFVDDRSPTLPGTGRVTVRHTADAPTVDVQLDGTDAITGLEAGVEAMADLPVDTYDVAVQVAPDGPVVLTLPEAAIAAGSATTVYAIGSAGGETLDLIVVGDTVDSAFTDVPVEHPFITEIQWFLDEGLSTGFADGTFRPGATISRQALAAFMARLSGAELAACTDAPFTDVPVEHPFCAEIAWMAAEGLSSGFADGSFQPGAPVSRQALSAFLYRYDGSPDGPEPTCDEAPFTDVAADHPFCGEIAWMASSGLSTGFDDGSFAPGASLSRQALAAFVYRFAQAAPGTT